MISLPMLRSDSTVSPVEAGAWRLCRGSLIQWNLDITKGQLPKGLAKFVRYRGVVISKFFSICVNITGVKKTTAFVIPRTWLHRGSIVSRT